MGIEIKDMRTKPEAPVVVRLDKDLNVISEPRTVRMVAIRTQLAPDQRGLVRRGGQFDAYEQEAVALEFTRLAVRLGADSPGALAATAAETKAPKPDAQKVVAPTNKKAK